jgi:hypothetical protein
LAGAPKTPKYADSELVLYCVYCKHESFWMAVPFTGSCRRVPMSLGLCPHWAFIAFIRIVCQSLCT